MQIMEIASYGILLLAGSFLLWFLIRTVIRLLKDKGILKTRKFNLKSWRPKE